MQRIMLTVIRAVLDMVDTMPHHIAELRFWQAQCLMNTAVPEWTKSAKHLLSWKLPKSRCIGCRAVGKVHTLTNDIFLKRGTEEQKKKYLALGASKVGDGVNRTPSVSDAKAQSKSPMGDDLYYQRHKMFYQQNTGTGRVVIMLYRLP